MTPTPQKACRVLLVNEGSGFPVAAQALFESGLITATGKPCSYGELPEVARQTRPDVVVLDLTSAEALPAIEELMAVRPTPVLLLHDPGEHHRVDPFAALALGALDVQKRPGSPSPQFYRELALRLPLLAQVRVVRHIKGGRRKPTLPSARIHNGAQAFPIVAIASSLGGPKALSIVLRGLPKSFPAPVVVCQHISDGFTDGLVHWLSAETGLSVVTAVEGDALGPGRVYVAPSGSHFVVTPDAKVSLELGPTFLGFKPSCTLLLSSVAASFGRRAVGVVLTGMGKDGAQGLKDIRDAGGRTLAQDEATSAVYGMPKEAVTLGAAERVLPLDDIAPSLIRLVAEC